MSNNLKFENTKVFGMEKTKVTDYDKADEVFRLKREKGTSWDAIYKIYNENGGAKRYKTAKSLYGAIKLGNIPDIDMLIEELKQIEVIKEAKDKKETKDKAIQMCSGLPRAQVNPSILD